MKLKTLFKVYVVVRDEMENIASRRPNGRFGIAVSADNLARQWQRLDRLADKINFRIQGKPFCPICGFWGEYHRSTCPRDKVKI